MSGVIQKVHLWRPAAALRVEGPDAATFLQGQFTNDLRKLATSGVSYGLLLDRKGHVQADSFVALAGGPNQFLIFSYFSPAESIHAHLERHLIADEVTLTDETPSWYGATVIVPSGVGPPASGIRFPARRGFRQAIEILSREPIPAPAAGEISSAEMEVARIAASIPRIPTDIGPGELPNEAGLEVDAISHTKGCYLGQEVIARLNSMGRVRRSLKRISGPGSPPPPHARLYQGTRIVGEIRSSVADNPGHFIALALLNLVHLDASAGLSPTPASEHRPNLFQIV